MLFRRKISLKVLLILVLLLVGTVSTLSYYYLSYLPSQNRSVKVTTFQVRPDVTPYITEYAIGSETSPNAIASDSSGDVWFALQNETAIAELIPENGTVREFKLPEPGNPQIYTWGITVDSTRNSVWFTDILSNAIWRYSISTGKMQEFPLSEKSSFPLRITLDSEGDAWFTELTSGRIGEITPSGQITEFSINGTAGASPGPSDIVVARDGTVWFTEAYADAIASFKNGKFTQYPLGRDVSYPTGLVIDSERNIWFTQHGPSFVSEFNPSTHAIKTFSTSLPPSGSSLPYWIEMDTNGVIWFNEHVGNAIASFDPNKGYLTEYEIPSRVSGAGNISGALTVTLSPKGIPWFTEWFSGKVGMVNTTNSPEISISLSKQISTPIYVPVKSNASINVEVSSRNLASTLGAEVGNNTEDFQFSFNPQSSAGNFSSTLTIENAGSPRGDYFVTITAETPDMRVSLILEVKSS